MLMAVPLIFLRASAAIALLKHGVEPLRWIVGPQPWQKPMRLREFITLLGCAIGAWPFAAQAHHSATPQFCGWIGAKVGPMTAAFANSLGLTELYGGILPAQKPLASVSFFCNRIDLNQFSDGIDMQLDFAPKDKRRSQGRAMSTKRILLIILIIVLAIVVFVAWTAWNDSQLGWTHLVGLGAIVLFLILIGF
jgi:hypothetical protein